MSNSVSPAADAAQKIAIGGITGAGGMFCALPGLNMQLALQARTPQQSVVNCVWEMFKKPTRLFNGAVPMCGGMLPAAAISYSVNSAVKSVLSENGKRELSKAEKIGAAAFGGVLSTAIVCPSEVLQVQMRDKTLLDSIRYVYAQKGLMGFYRGAGATAVRESAFTAIWLGMGSGNVTPAVQMATAVFGTVATQPLHTRVKWLQNNLTAPRPSIWNMVRAGALVGVVPRGVAFFSYVGAAPRIQAALESKLSPKKENKPA